MTRASYRSFLIGLVLLLAGALMVDGWAQAPAGEGGAAAAPAAPAAVPAKAAGAEKAPGEETGAADESPDQINNDQVVQREEMKQKADSLYVQGNEAALKGDFEAAIRHLSQAESNYREVTAFQPVVNERLKQTQELLADVYQKWADQLVRQALKEKKARNFDEALKNYNEALRLNPKLKDEVRERIAEIQQEKKRIEMEDELNKTIPDREEREEELFKLLEKGRILYEAQRYMRAREFFEQVLIKDPYNVAATRYLKTMYEDMRNDAQRRRWLIIRERMAEIEWKWVDPVPSPDLVKAPGAGEAGGEPVAKTDTIRDKLENIIIPSIQFQEATISTVVSYLKDRSKTLDPESKGVNIFLMLAPPGAKKSGEAAAAAATAAGGPGGEGGAGGIEIDETPPADGTTEGPAAAVEGEKELTITMDFNHIPLGEAIRYICAGTGLKYRVEPHAVIIADPSVPLEPMDTRFFRVKPSIMDVRATAQGKTISSDDDDDSGGSSVKTAAEAEAAVRAMFEGYGISFPEGSSIRYEARVSKLIVTNTPDNLRRIELILKELIDDPMQVTIEAKFMEVRQTAINELSFSWSFQGNKNSDGTLGPYQHKWGEMNFSIPGQAGATEGGALTTGSLANATRNVSTFGNLFSVVSIVDQLQFNTLVYWFDRQGGADVLSAPKVTTVSGQTAVIRMVEERRFPESFTQPEFSTTDGVTSYTPPTPEFGESRDIGVVLTVTPTIDATDKYTIDLELSPEVLEFTGMDTSYNTKALVNGSEVELRYDTPIIERRSVETRVNVWDGETVVLGGTIKDKVEKIHDKIPFIGDWPLIGRLFRSEGESSEKKNLLIFVSARIINPAGLPIRPQENVRGLPDFRR